MPQNPYREPYTLDSTIQVAVEKSVAEAIKMMSQHMKVQEGELVNTALRRFIATHNDYLPKSAKKKH